MHLPGEVDHALVQGGQQGRGDVQRVFIAGHLDHLPSGEQPGQGGVESRLFYLRPGEQLAPGKGQPPLLDHQQHQVPGDACFTPCQSFEHRRLVVAVLLGVGIEDTPSADGGDGGI